MKEQHCLNCNAELGGNTETKLRNVSPSPGSFSICAYCGHLAVYADDLQLRELTEDEIVQAAGNTELLFAQRIAYQWRMERDKK